MASILEEQLALLRAEIELINSSIRQMDEITKSIKEWAIVTWAGAVGVCLADTSLRPRLLLTAILPLLFWLVDASFRRVQRRFIYRMRVIRTFVNERLPIAVTSGQVTDFVLLDPAAETGDALARDEHRDWLRVLAFGTLSILYVGLATASIVVHVVLT